MFIAQLTFISKFLKFINGISLVLHYWSYATGLDTITYSTTSQMLRCVIATSPGLYPPKPGPHSRTITLCTFYSKVCHKQELTVGRLRFL